MKLNKVLTITGVILATLSLTACGGEDNETSEYPNTNVIESSEISGGESGSQEFTFDESDGDGIMMTVDEDGNETMEFIEINEDEIIEE